MKIADFLKHVSEMSADTDYKFSLEYEVRIVFYEAITFILKKS